MKGKKAPAQERFAAFLDTSGGPDACHEWQGSRNNQGYGLFDFDGRTTLAHRCAWMLVNGPVPTETPVIMHTCDNRPCCNIRHLRAGTYVDNGRDMMEKGRDGKSKLSPEDVHEIRRRLADGEQQKIIAVDYEVHPVTIGSIYRGVSWTHL